LTIFPNGKFDDQCDSTSQALDWVKTDSGDYVRLLKSMADRSASDNSGERVEPEPCPFCRSRETFPEGDEVRCRGCGKRWDRVIRTHPKVTRADMLNGRWGF